MEREVQLNPRETMTALPAFVQPFLTWLTGMPHDGQSPRFQWSPWTLLLCIGLEIIMGLSFGISAFRLPAFAAPFLLSASWILTTGGVRTLYVVIEHSCTHHIFAKTALTNRTVAEIISVIFWTQSYEQFKSEHSTHHQITRLAVDPDSHFLREWGFFPGMTAEEALRQLLRVALSPKYHVANFSDRLRSSYSGSIVNIHRQSRWL